MSFSLIALHGILGIRGLAMSRFFFGRLRSFHPAHEEIRPKNRAAGNDEEAKAPSAFLRAVIDLFHAEEDKERAENQPDGKIDPQNHQQD